jgi:hypothetical protein
VKDIHLFELVSQILSLVGPQNSQGKTDQGPQVYNGVVAAVMLTQFVDLRMAVVATGNAVICSGGLDLIVLQLPIGQALFLETGLEKAATATATIVVGSVRLHVDEVLLPNDGPDHKSQIFSHGIPIAFANDLAGVLNRKFDFQILVPIGIDLEFSFPDPFGIVFVDVFNLKIMLDVEFFQSFQD